MNNLVKLKKEELMEIDEGGWFQVLRVLAVAAAAIREVVHDDVCVQASDSGQRSNWASAACEGCQA